MIANAVPDRAQNDYEFPDQQRKRKVQEMKKLIYKFDITTNELGLQLSG
jgi:transposase